ncbi:MAG: hypothetical protein ACE5HE_10045 [Phycisphaerae bacterium]
MTTARNVALASSYVNPEAWLINEHHLITPPIAKLDRVAGTLRANVYNRYGAAPLWTTLRKR